MTRIKIKHLLEKYISTIMPVLIFLLGFFVGRNYPDILNQVVVLTKEYSSLIVAVATISLVGVTKSLVRVTINQNKPWLYFYFKRKSLPNIQNYIQSPSLYVKNVGKGPAIKIEFKIEQTERSLHALSPDEEVNINDWKIREKYWINYYMNNKLVNHTTGGEGGSADPNTRGDEGTPGLKGNGIFIDGDASEIERLLGGFAGDVLWG